MVSPVYEIANSLLGLERYGSHIQAHIFTDKVLEAAGITITVSDPDYSWYLEGCKRVVEQHYPAYYLADIHQPV